VHDDAGGVGALGAAAQSLEALEVDIAGVHGTLPVQRGGELQRLASGAGAEIEHGVTGSRLHELAEQLAAFVLHLEVGAAQAEQVRAL
jgi:hypothetical protein